MIVRIAKLEAAHIFPHATRIYLMDHEAIDWPTLMLLMVEGPQNLLAIHAWDNNNPQI